MIRIKDTIQTERITFNFVENKRDFAEALEFAENLKVAAFDTESTGINCYKPGWALRAFQFSDRNTSYMLPALRRPIETIVSLPIRWIAFNGAHDVRCLDEFFGFLSGMKVTIETYIKSHHFEPRKFEDGGVNYGLKERCIEFVDPSSGKWEHALKQSFKQIYVPMPGEVYKSGPRKGKPKVRKALLSEGWALQDLRHPAYIAYSAADPILTYRLSEVVSLGVQDRKLYKRDKRIDAICDTLHRRGMRIDVEYTKKYQAELLERANHYEGLARRYGCKNINSSDQVSWTLQHLGADLSRRTKSGKFKADNDVLENAITNGNPKVRKFAQCVLNSRRLTKRAKVYAEGMLRELDANGRVHPSINSLAARTGRMSAGIFQQLPTKEESE